VLASTEILPPAIPVLHNADVSIQSDAEGIRRLLAAQLYQPVRWVESIEKIAAEGIQQIIECGPGKVLTGLHKRINKSLNTLPVFDNQSLDAALQTIACATSNE